MDFSIGLKKKRYPFLLGTTSYIIPGDILPNVKLLAPIVDDIELVLFESAENSNIPSNAVINELAMIASDNCCGYTVHLPTDSKCGAEDAKQRRQYLDNALRVIERTRPLSPRAWIVHCEGVERGVSKEEVASWQRRCISVVGMLASECGEGRLLAIENLKYPMEWNTTIRNVCGTSLCLDVGHLWAFNEERWQEECKEALSSTSVIHLHGVNSGQDHLSLQQGDIVKTRLLLDMLNDCEYRGVVTLEVFNCNDFNESASIMADIWENRRF